MTSAVTAGAVVDLALRRTTPTAPTTTGARPGANAPQLVVSTTAASTATDHGIVIAAVGDARVRAGERRHVDHVPAAVGVEPDPERPAVQHFLALGDLQYENGELASFQSAYEASYGRFKAKTKPAPGNHEYNTASASGYYTYFGAPAGDPTKGYYSFDVGTTWHIVALNSNCSVVSCAAGSAQEQWLRADLAASTRPCTIAYWHHPRFSSSSRGNDTSVDPLWHALAERRRRDRPRRPRALLRALRPAERRRRGRRERRAPVHRRHRRQEHGRLRTPSSRTASCACRASACSS